MGERMTIKELEEYRKTHHNIPPEKILAAYEGLSVEKINPAFVVKMDQAKFPNLVLDKDLKLLGVYYGVDYEKQGYIQIENDELGQYLIKPEKDANGRAIIPEGWVDSHDYDDWADECAAELNI